MNDFAILLMFLLDSVIDALDLSLFFVLFLITTMPRNINSNFWTCD